MLFVKNREINNIVEKFACGDENAFRELYDRYVVSLRYFASKYISDSDAVEDIIQEVFVKLWEERVCFAAEQALKVFLYKSVRNSCLNILRHQDVRRKYAESILHEDQTEFFLDQIIETEVLDILMGVFKELSPMCQKVYRMSLNGDKHNQIADKLGISVNTVKKYKNNANHYIRWRLRKMMILLFLFE